MRGSVAGVGVLAELNAMNPTPKLSKKEREQKQREEARSATAARKAEDEEPEADPAEVERRVDAAEDAEVDAQVRKALDELDLPYILLRWGWPNDDWVEAALKRIERVNELCGFDAKPVLLEFLGLPAETDPKQFKWDATNADYVARLKTPGPIAKKLKPEQAHRLTLAVAVVRNNPCVLDSLTTRSREEWDAWREKTEKRVEKEVLAEAKKAAKAAAKTKASEAEDADEPEGAAAA